MNRAHHDRRVCKNARTRLGWPVLDLCRTRAKSAVCALLCAAACAFVSDDATAQAGSTNSKEESSQLAKPNAGAPITVLIIHSWGRDFAPFNAVALAFRTELARQTSSRSRFVRCRSTPSAQPADRRAPVRRVPAQPPRHGTDRPGGDARCVGDALLRAPPRTLFPDAPLLVTGIGQRRLHGIQLESRDRVVSINSGHQAHRRQHPQGASRTGTLVFVQGSSRIDRIERTEYQALLAPLANRVRLIWLHDLTHGEPARACRLPAARLGHHLRPLRGRRERRALRQANGHSPQCAKWPTRRYSASTTASSAPASSVAPCCNCARWARWRARPRSACWKADPKPMRPPWCWRQPHRHTTGAN